MVYRYFVELKRKSDRSRAASISRTYAIVVVYKFYENKTIKTMTTFQLILAFPLLTFEWFDRVLVRACDSDKNLCSRVPLRVSRDIVRKSFPVPIVVVWKKGTIRRLLSHRYLIQWYCVLSSVPMYIMLSAARAHVCADLFLLR